MPALRAGHNLPVATGLGPGAHRVVVVVHPYAGKEDDKVQIGWAGAAGLARTTAEGAVFVPRQWWLVGPYACYSAADFEANEAIENARNSGDGGNEWNRVIGMGGRELRPVVVAGESTGMLDLQAVLGPVPTNVCAYAGFRVRAKKRGR